MSTAPLGCHDGTVSTPVTDPRADPAAPRKAYRDPDEAILGGVAAGLAEHLGLPVMWVRVDFMAARRDGRLRGDVLRRALDGAARAAALRRPGPGPRGGRRGRAGVPGRIRRLADFGPLVATGAIASGSPCSPWPPPAAGRLFGPLLLAVVGVARALAAGRRGPAGALARLHRRDQRGARGRRDRRGGGVPAAGGRAGSCSSARSRSSRWPAATGPPRATSGWPRSCASSASASSWARGCSGCPPTSARSAPSGSAPRSGPTSPRTCTTRCCRRSR